jgi:PAS domain S-box-containing protein
MSDLYEERDKDRLRDRLRKSEARFRNVIARSVDAILVLDMRGTVLFANPVAEKLFCKSASDLVGQYFGYPVVGGAKTELDIRHGPDSFYVGEMRVVETEWEDEPALLATIRDVTERKQMEEALAASEARLRVVFESSLDAMLVLDDNAVYVDANPAACDMFKLDRANCLGHSLADFMADPTGFKQLWRAITRAGRKRGEIKLRLPDGSNSEVEYSAVRNILPERHLISLRDITRRKRAEAMNEALNRITTGIAGTFDFDEIFRRSMEDATKALDCESATVLLRESDEWIVRHVHGLAGIPVGLRFSSREAIIQAIAERTRAPVVVNDAAEDERVNPDSLRHFGFKSFIAIPLTVRGDVIGTLSFHRISRRSDFTKAQVEFARSLAAALSLALENARVYQAERTIADTLQRALLVMPEHVEGIDYGHLYQSASEAAMVGGDFYDIFELEHGKVGLLIGDVAGKGLEAATLTSLVKHAVGAYALEGHTPSAITSKVNNMILASNLVGATFVTAFVGVLDTRATLKRCVNC